MTRPDISVVKKGKSKALKSLIAQVKVKRDLFINNEHDLLIKDFGGRRCKSMIEFDNEKEEDDRKISSYP